MIIWYREILNPLEENNLLSNISLKLFKKYLIKEINKIFETNNTNYMLKLKDLPAKNTIKDDFEVYFYLEGINNNINNSSEIIQISNKNKTMTSIMSTSHSNNSTQTSFTQPSLSVNKEKINEEYSSVEFQTEYFIEQYINIYCKDFNQYDGFFF